MKLKKTWMGICVWVIYLIGIIFAIGVTGFVSGLFPYYGQYLEAGAAVLASALAALIVAAIGSFIGEKIRFQIPIWLEIIVPIVLLAVSFFTLDISSQMADKYTGNMALYDSAIVASGGQDTLRLGIADSVYVVLLRCVITFIGNSLVAALTLNTVLRMLMILFMYIALRVSVGFVGALASAVTMLALPAFGYTLCELSPAQFFYTAAALVLMMAAVYVRGLAKNGDMWWFRIFIVLFGMAFGVMLYFDFGMIGLLVFWIAAFFVRDRECSDVSFIINQISVPVFGVLFYLVMMTLDIGYFDIAAIANNIALMFTGAHSSMWILMTTHTVNNAVLLLGLLAAAFIPAYLFLRRGRCEAVIPWMAFCAAGAVLSFFMSEASFLNSEIMLLTFAAVLIGCGFACFGYFDEEAEYENRRLEPEVHEDMIHPIALNPEKMSDIADAEKEELTELEAPEMVVVPEKTVVSENVVVPESKEIPEETTQTDNTQNEDENTAEEPEKNENKERPRFVPEGMVLPEGDEDEENLVPNFNMNRPEMQDIGILSVGVAAAAVAGAVSEASAEDENAKEENVNEETTHEEVSVEEVAAEENVPEETPSDEKETSKEDSTCEVPSNAPDREIPVGMEPRIFKVSDSTPDMNEFDINIAPGDDFDI